ncbi:uncharacterized protein BXZ73DRAFT_85093 [Epithele typhae]|uniref:uncharacterized protein n=1 Tax=Epithele typhae TaxID=378194 RepID=UPI002007467A|nr:uncharacterized protein BXZ73DRAFT_85093 [Epithele typhae]KAH9905536.1 hypothetical protein BXZ73DRAFT_85093 [Epithele typhae]
MSVHVGGFWFPADAVHHLLMKAYGLANVTPRTPPSPQHFTSTTTTTSIAPVSLSITSGTDLANLSKDTSFAMACADYWFPPWLRELEVFKDVRYIQYEYTGYITIPIIYWKEKEYDMAPQQNRYPTIPKWLRKRQERGRTFAYMPPGVPALYVYDDDDSANTTDSDSTQSSQVTPSPWTSVQHPRRRVGRTSN